MCRSALSTYRPTPGKSGHSRSPSTTALGAARYSLERVVHEGNTAGPFTTTLFEERTHGPQPAVDASRRGHLHAALDPAIPRSRMVPLMSSRHCGHETLR